MHLNGLKPCKLSNNSILPIEETLTVKTVSGGPGSTSNEGVLYILQRCSLVLLRTFIGRVSNSSKEMQSVYSTATANWFVSASGLTNLKLKSNILNYHIYPTPPLGQDMTQGQFF